MQVGFLSYLNSRTNQTQAVLLGGKNGRLFNSVHDELRVGHKPTDTLTIDGASQLRRMEPLGDVVF